VTLLLRDTGVLVWAPDTRRFARGVEEGVHQLTVAIYERSGETFRAIAKIDNYRDLAAARAAFDENWKKSAASEKERVKKEATESWPEIEKNAEAWRTDAIANTEKAAAEFSLRWPEPQREQWRRLSLTGGFGALEKRIGWEWPCAKIKRKLRDI
jgi:hypothetical protein